MCVLFVWFTTFSVTVDTSPNTDFASFPFQRPPDDLYHEHTAFFGPYVQRTGKNPPIIENTYTFLIDRGGRESTPVCHILQAFTHGERREPTFTLKASGKTYPGAGSPAEKWPNLLTGRSEDSTCRRRGMKLDITLLVLPRCDKCKYIMIRW